MQYFFFCPKFQIQGQFKGDLSCLLIRASELPQGCAFLVLKSDIRPSLLGEQSKGLIKYDEVCPVAAGSRLWAMVKGNLQFAFFLWFRRLQFSKMLTLYQRQEWRQWEHKQYDVYCGIVVPPLTALLSLGALRSLHTKGHLCCLLGRGDCGLGHCSKEILCKQCGFRSVFWVIRIIAMVQ